MTTGESLLKRIRKYKINAEIIILYVTYLYRKVKRVVGETVPVDSVCENKMWLSL